MGVAFYFSQAGRFDLAQVGNMPARTTILDRHGAGSGQ
jgi:hypothetical protein